MNVAAGPRLAAAVTNAGGIGVIGGVRQSPKMLQETINELKSHLEDKKAPFGVDLLLPQVGGNARKTNVRSFFLSFKYRCADTRTTFSMITRMASLTNS
jgi:NAD(P)H-dependent flavin oxidoreductase YrpB (nitropropane dioxygenase family)